jgi:hypothetical protein
MMPPYKRQRSGAYPHRLQENRTWRTRALRPGGSEHAVQVLDGRLTAPRPQPNVSYTRTTRDQTDDLSLFITLNRPGPQATRARHGTKPRVSPGREPHSPPHNIELDITQGRKGPQAANVRQLTTPSRTADAGIGGLARWPAGQDGG